MNLNNVFNKLASKIEEAESLLDGVRIDSPTYGTIVDNIEKTLSLFSKTGEGDSSNENVRKVSKELPEELKENIGKDYESLNEEFLPDEIDMVVFKSEGCLPCSKLMKIIDEIENDASIQIVDSQEDFDHATKYGITSFPVVFYLKGGMINDITLGHSDEEDADFYLKKLG